MHNSNFDRRKTEEPKINAKSLNVLLIILTILVLVSAAIYTMRVIQASMVLKLTDIYNEAFDTPITSIESLSGGGNVGGYYDVWLRFKCPGGATLKDESQYESKRTSQALRWFEDKFPEDKDLPSAMHLTLLWRTRSEVTKVTNQWLLCNVATATYYYRAWGFK